MFWIVILKVCQSWLKYLKEKLSQAEASLAKRQQLLK
jgi:hypothetical protein